MSFWYKKAEFLANMAVVKKQHTCHQHTHNVCQAKVLNKTLAKKPKNVVDKIAINWEWYLAHTTIYPIPVQSRLPHLK
jgi:hypothetical protein